MYDNLFFGTIERIIDGAKLLDEARPMWRDEIAPGALLMHDTEFCVLGQAFGAYGAGVTELARTSTHGRDVGKSPRAFGFDLSHDVWKKAMEITAEEGWTDEADFDMANVMAWYPYDYGWTMLIKGEWTYEGGDVSEVA